MSTAARRATEHRASRVSRIGLAMAYAVVGVIHAGRVIDWPFRARPDLRPEMPRTEVDQ